ncbi:MAG: Uma2 family endonuclease [bacterium]|nr:Uma2 family endonuclease [bacterium]MCS7309975.1 Uma2 family endonuclease [Armatimonadota bacterium]
MAVQQLPKTTVEYPDSDGQPMAENTKQLEYIVYLYDNLCALFADREDVFVAADLLWYPVEGRPDIRTAPDVMVAFGRPKGHRGSYKQWEEGGVAPQVVFEVVSPGNRYAELVEKFRFYERYGVEEYYLYDPDLGVFNGWIRREHTLEPIEQMESWVSPRLGVRFALEGSALVAYRPDGERFIPYVELRRRAERERERADAISRELEKERQRAERLAQKLRELGVDPNEV